MTSKQQWHYYGGICILVCAAALLALAAPWHGAAANGVPGTFEPDAPRVDTTHFSARRPAATVSTFDHAAAHRFTLADGAYHPRAVADDCQQLLDNTAFDVVDGSVPSWTVLAPKVYYSTQSYASPQHSLVLPDGDADDPSPTQDAFGQIFDMPADLTSVTIEYHTATGNANGADKASGNLWTVDNDDHLVDFLGGWEIADSPEAWVQRSVLIQDSADLAPMAGQRLAIVLFTETDGQAPDEIVFLDDITLTACTGTTEPPTPLPSDNNVHLPFVVRGYHPLLLYFDDFSDPNSGWHTGDDERRTVRYLNGEYQILIKQAQNGLVVTPDLVLPSDYRIEADARQASSNAGSYGLMFGIQWGADTYEGYQVIVYPDTQEYLLDKRNWDGSWSMLIDWTYSPAIHQGMGTNHLRVDRVGTVIYVYINGTLVTTFTDSSFTSAGRDAGVRVYSYNSAPVDVRFDNFGAYRAP